jgi:leucyl-tRNA synthetase
VKYKLRDWLFSRQRYWGEPFPIVLDAEGNAYALPESELPLTLPEMEDFKPTGTPEPPLSKAKDWVNVEIDGKRFHARDQHDAAMGGSCWYYLRYIDPKNPERFVDPEKEKYWMPVDLYVGGVEHAVLHLLYARFWHKVLFDLGHVSRPSRSRLVNQGLILGEMEPRFGRPATPSTELRDVDEEEEGAKRPAKKLIGGADARSKNPATAIAIRSAIRVDGRSFKMSKSRGNVVNPDEIVAITGPIRSVSMRCISARWSAEAVEHARHRRHEPVPQQRLAKSDRREDEAEKHGLPVAHRPDGPIPEALDR